MTPQPQQELPEGWCVVEAGTQSGGINYDVFHDGAHFAIAFSREAGNYIARCVDAGYTRSRPAPAPEDQLVWMTPEEEEKRIRKAERERVLEILHRLRNALEEKEMRSDVSLPQSIKFGAGRVVIEGAIRMIL